MKQKIIYISVICLAAALVIVSVILYSVVQPKYCNSKEDLSSKLESTFEQYGKVHIVKTVDYKEYRMVGFTTDNNAAGAALLEKTNGKDYSFADSSVDEDTKYPTIRQVTTSDGDVIMFYVLFNDKIKEIEIRDKNDKLVKTCKLNDSNKNVGFIKIKDSVKAMYSIRCIDASGKAI